MNLLGLSVKFRCSSRHAHQASICACVLSGEIRNQVDGEVGRVYRRGESDTEPTRLLAVLIIDVADKQLTIPDPQ